MDGRMFHIQTFKCFKAICSNGMGEPNRWCEVAFKPFGIMLCHESQPAKKEMLDITYFKRYDYD